MGGPTLGAREADGSSWAERRWAALGLRVGVMIAPAVASLGTAAIVSGALTRPSGVLGLVMFLVLVMVAAVGGAVVTERAMRRLRPLVNLLSMSLVFPDQAPSRFGVALRTGTARQLQRSLQQVTTEGFSGDETEAAQQLLDMVHALGEHEPLTRGHTERVRAYADLIATELRLGEDERNQLRWSPMIHDIGKLGVPAGS